MSEPQGSKKIDRSEARKSASSLSGFMETFKGGDHPSTDYSPPLSILKDNPDGLRLIPIADYKKAAQCLAEAFADDPVAMYFINTPDRAHWTAEQKWDLHVSILEYVTYAHCLKGLALTIGPNYDSVALW